MRPATAEAGATLEAAMRGDARAFEALVTPLRQGLRGYCYRMLGSLSDAEDAVQETLVRGWKALASFQGRSALRTWLYQIATRVCLDQLGSKAGRVLPHEVHPKAGPGEAPTLDAAYQHLDPAPDSWVETEVGPDAVVERKESVALAFMVALQTLPASQRAVLVLRDVLGLQATEVAELLETTVAAVNSALQRARATLEAKGGQAHLRVVRDEAERDLLGRYLKVWESSDVSSLLALLREDAVLSMPPMSQWWEGAQQVAGFLGYLLTTPDPQKYRAVPTRASGLPALAIYARAAPGQPWLPASLHLLELKDGRIAHCIAWVVPALFERFGLPAKLV